MFLSTAVKLQKHHIIISPFVFFSKLIHFNLGLFSPYNTVPTPQEGSPINLIHFFTFSYKADRLQRDLLCPENSLEPIFYQAQLTRALRPNALRADLHSHKGGGCSKNS